MNVGLNMSTEYMNETIDKLYSARARFERKFRDVSIDFKFVDKEIIKIKMFMNKNYSVRIDRFISCVELDCSVANYSIDYLLNEMRTKLIRGIYGY